MSGSKHLACVVGLAAPVLAFICFAVGDGLRDLDGDLCLDRDSTITSPKLIALKTARQYMILYVVSSVFALATCVAWVNCCCEQYGRTRDVTFEPMTHPAHSTQVPMYVFATPSTSP